VRSANASAAADVAAPVARSKTIAVAAREAGVHVETIRYYERLGLIPRPAARSGYRLYPASTIERVRSIKRAQDFGFTLREIDEFFGLSGGSCKEMCAKVDEKVREIEARIAALIELRDELRGLVSKSAQTGPASNCQVFKAFVRPL
jgi:MerR family mercuric resistance operon transcriptional regulator